MEIDPGRLATEFRALERKPENFDPEAECEHLAQLVREELRDQLAEYEDPKASGAGGSGLVISAVYAPFINRRSIKVPRKNAQVSLSTEEDPFVDPELHALSKVSHQNITRLYNAHPLSNGGYCMITEHVETPKPLDEYATALCCSEECRKSEYTLLSKTKELARIIYQIADALVYMHDSAGLLHFDIKPDNILVSANDHPFVTDLGFARDLTRYAAGTTVEVGFTYKYAHPSLTDPDLGARVSSDPRRSKNRIPSERLLSVIDVFAFGRTLQEVLRQLEMVYGDSIYSNYVFNFLHMIACLSLDGRNSANGHHSATHSFVSDRALGMPTALFAAHKFSSRLLKNRVSK